jgi:hypothetical protein
VSLPKRFRGYEFCLDLCEGFGALAAANGSDAVRNRCSVCMSLVFGGESGKSDSYTLYAGSLDDPSTFHPTIAIFAASRAPWTIIPPGFKVFDRITP